MTGSGPPVVPVKITVTQPASSRPLHRMPVAPVRVSNPTTGRTINTYAALDTAAEYSLCSPGLSELLGLEGEEVLNSVVGATGTAEHGESLRV